MAAAPPMRPAYELRPLSIGELIDYSVRMYQRLFPYAVLPYALLMTPFNALAKTENVLNKYGTEYRRAQHDSTFFSPGVVQHVLDRTGVDLTFLLHWQADPLHWFLGWGCLLVLYLALNAVARAGIVAIVHERVRGIPPSLSRILDAYRQSGLRATVLSLLCLLITGVLLGIPIALIAAAYGGPNHKFAYDSSSKLVGYGGMLLLVPALLVTIWFGMFALISETALVIEGLAPITALRRGYALVRGLWWRGFGIMALLYLVLWLVRSILTHGLDALLFRAAPQAQIVTAIIVTTLLTTFFEPLFRVALVLIYLDLRVRKEHLDLYTLLDATHA